MNYDFRNNPGGGHYRPTSSTHPMYGHPNPMYPNPNPNPRVSQHPHFSVSSLPRPSPSPSPSPSSSGLGIRVTIKPEFRITPPPQLSPEVGDIPRSNFQFDFDFERKVLAEADKESPNWTRLGSENLSSKPLESSSSSMGSVGDPIVRKYIASGLSREAVPFAVANYGDNPTKVQEFVKGYTLLQEMGFSSNNIVEALLMYDNDTDKALAHFLNNSS